MIDREKVLAVLQKRFPGSSAEERAAAANAIVGLDDEWTDLSAWETALGCQVSARCTEVCVLAEQRRQGADLRVLVKKRVDS